MSLETELCQRVYSHHTVLKSEMTNALLVALKKHNLTREALNEIMNAANATVDAASNKLVLDVQKTLKNNK